MADNKQALIMCQTPLQALIAEKIIEINADKVFYPVYTAYEWNDKHDYYSTRLIDQCGDGVKEELSNIAVIVKLVTDLEKLSFSDIYLASIDAPLNLAVLSAKEGINLYTYDDGSANITPKSFYFRKENNPIHYPNLHITWNKEKVKEKSLKHYTIFNTSFNVVPSNRLEKIELFSFDKAKKEHGKEVSVLIGQRVIASAVQNERLMIQAMNDYHIDYFFPHPREKRLDALKFKTIDTPHIFEEFYVELLKDYDMIHLYHFFSTVAFNLREHPQIQEHIIDKRFYDGWYFQIE